MKKYGLHGKLTAKAGQVDQLADILIQASQLVAKAKGCQVYAIGRDADDPHSVWITEIWDSKEDHDNSLQAPEIRALIGQAMPLLDGRPEKGQELDIMGGVGVTK